MTKFKYLILSVLSIIPYIASADAIYKCDFEDPKECAKWHLEPIITQLQAPYLANKWYIGAPGNFTTEEGNGLYISSDGGKNATYDAIEDKPSYVLTWRTLSIPKGDYDLYFDWKAMGKPSGTDAIFVYWVTDNSLELKSAAGSMGINKKYEPFFIGDTLSLAATWQKAHFAFENTSSDSIRLAFLWNTDPENLTNPAACIDNIEIHKKNNCDAPFNISHSFPASDGSTVRVTWKGHSDMYSIICYDPETQEVITVDSIKVWNTGATQTNSYDFKDLTQGVRTIYIRSYCKNSDGTYEASDYATYTLLIYLNTEGCVPFLDLGRAKCYVSSIVNGYKWGNPTDPIDRGYASSMSRHTIHYLENEYDPRTENKLKTVPYGNYASVRLGNWEVNSESERIEYSFTPQKGESDILKIKYAVVMDSDIPEEWKHNKSDQPKFNLEIYYKEGDSIVQYNPACYTIDFSAGYSDDDVDSEWNLHYTNEEKTIGVYWKDWDSLSISLSEFVGKETIIRLTTRDCNHGGHYGYAYFTLDCEAGTLFGTTCGKFNNQFIAPDGFENYVWFRESDLNTPLTPNDRTRDGQRMVSDDGKMLTIDNDDISTYVLKVYFNEANDCYFTLFANGLPRIPIAKADTANVHMASCQYVVGFKNESYISIRDDRFNIDSIDADMKPDYFEWIFEDTTIVTSSLSEIINHRYADGGDKVVYLKAGITTCDTVTIDTIRFHLDPLGNMESTTRKDICIGDSYTYMDADNKPHMYMDNIEQDFVWTLGQGCDSIDHFILVVHDTLFRDTMTLCPSSLPYTIEGCPTQVTASGEYRAKFKNASCDCDSIILWQVDLEEVDIATEDITINCIDGGNLDIPYQLVKGTIDSICISFPNESPVLEKTYCFANTDLGDGSSISIPLIDGIAPGRYPAILSFRSQSVCPTADKHITVEISYSSQVLSQKENNGWIGLRNEEEFDDATFQWYKDGELIEGATNSYYPIADNDGGHSFYVVITKNGQSVSTCPIVYGGNTGIENIRNEVYNCEIFTILGEKIYAGKSSNMPNLSKGRIYIIHNSDRQESYKIYNR